MELSALNNTYLPDQLTSDFAADWSKDGRLFVITGADIYVLRFSPCVTNTDNSLTFVRSTVNVDSYHVAKDTGVNMESILLDLAKPNLYHSILNSKLTPKLSNANPAVIKPNMAVWSPTFEDTKNRINSLLAVVSNSGNVEIFTQKRNKLIAIINLTKMWVKHLKESWRMESAPNNGDKGYETHCRRVNQAMATCMTWSKIYKENNCSYFYVTLGHINGILSIWKVDVNAPRENLNPVLVHTYNTELQQLTALHFYTTYNDLAGLVVGNLDGYVKCVSITNLNPKNFKMGKTVEVWIFKDIRVSQIRSVNYDDSVCIIIVKGPNIIFTLLDQKSVVICTKHLNVGNINITGIQPIRFGHFLLTTLPGVLKVLKVKKANKDLLYELSPVTLDVKWDYHSCHGVMKSPNGIFWGILTHPCKTTDHLVLRNPVQIIFCINAKFDPGKFLRTITTWRLFNSWECLEVIRCLSSKNNTLPCSWLPEREHLEALTLPELRIYMYISQMCESFIEKKAKCRKLKKTLPSSQIIQQVILFKYRLNRIKALSDLYIPEKPLNLFQLHSLSLTVDAVTRFFESTVFKEYLKEESSEEFYEILKQVEKVPVESPICRICGDNLSSVPCRINHPDHRCCISLVPVQGIPKWECEMCSLVADENLPEDELFCPLCDMPFVQNS